MIKGLKDFNWWALIILLCAVAFIYVAREDNIATGHYGHRESERLCERGYAASSASSEMSTAIDDLKDDMQTQIDSTNDDLQALKDDLEYAKGMEDDTN